MPGYTFGSITAATLGNITIYWGTAGPDTWAVPAPLTVLVGLSGADTLSSGFNLTALFGGSDDDVLDTRFDLIQPGALDIAIAQYGGAGNDTMTVEITALADDASGQVYLGGGAGDDTIVTTLTIDAAGADQLVQNLVYGGLGNDHIEAVHR